MENELYHYGVLGMKWGIRKDANKAHARASKKLSKLDKRAVKAAEKANKYEKEYIEKRYKLQSSNPFVFRGRLAKKVAKLDMQYDRMAAKSYLARDKAIKWYKKMEKAFKDITLTDIDPEYLKLGQTYANLLLEEQHVRRGRTDSYRKGL